MEKSIIIELCGKIAQPISEEEETVSCYINSMQVREEGCYMKDYVIDSSGKIIKTDVLHISN